MDNNATTSLEITENNITPQTRRLTRSQQIKDRAQRLRMLKQRILQTIRAKNKQPVRWIVTRKTAIRVKKLSPHAVIPVKRSAQAAGFDLSTPYEFFLPPMMTTTIELGIALQIPAGYYGRIAERSGVSRTLSLSVLGGVIDADYRGDVSVILINLGSHLARLPKHSRIAQLVLEKIHDNHDMEEVTELDVTERNGNGFGSTGSI